jgi:hypothetical protein
MGRLHPRIQEPTSEILGVLGSFLQQRCSLTPRKVLSAAICEISGICVGF